MKLKINKCNSQGSMSSTKTWQIFKLTVIKLNKTNSLTANPFLINSSVK